MSDAFKKLEDEKKDYEKMLEKLQSCKPVDQALEDERMEHWYSSCFAYIEMDDSSPTTHANQHRRRKSLHAMETNEEKKKVWNSNLTLTKLLRGKTDVEIENMVDALQFAEKAIILEQEALVPELRPFPSEIPSISRDIIGSLRFFLKDTLTKREERKDVRRASSTLHKISKEAIELENSGIVHERSHSIIERAAGQKLYQLLNNERCVAPISLYIHGVAILFEDALPRKFHRASSVMHASGLIAIFAVLWDLATLKNGIVIQNPIFRGTITLSGVASSCLMHFALILAKNCVLAIFRTQYFILLKAPIVSRKKAENQIELMLRNAEKEELFENAGTQGQLLIRSMVGNVNSPWETIKETDHYRLYRRFHVDGNNKMTSVVELKFDFILNVELMKFFKEFTAKNDEGSVWKQTNRKGSSSNFTVLMYRRLNVAFPGISDRFFCFLLEVNLQKERGFATFASRFREKDLEYVPTEVTKGATLAKTHICGVCLERIDDKHTKFTQVISTEVGGLIPRNRTSTFYVNAMLAGVALLGSVGLLTFLHLRHRSSVLQPEHGTNLSPLETTAKENKTGKKNKNKKKKKEMSHPVVRIPSAAEKVCNELHNTVRPFDRKRLQTIFNEYSVSPTMGFLSVDNKEPLRRLCHHQDDESPWQWYEIVAHHLPRLLAAHNLRKVVAHKNTMTFGSSNTTTSSPVTAASPSSSIIVSYNSSSSLPKKIRESIKGMDERELRRAYLILSAITHGYVWEELPPPNHSIEVPSEKLVKNQAILPKIIAEPLCQVAKRLGMPPVLVHASIVLYNWRLVDPNGPIHTSNIMLTQAIEGGADEAWFFLLTADIEMDGVPALVAIVYATKFIKRIQATKWFDDYPTSKKEKEKLKKKDEEDKRLLLKCLDIIRTSLQKMTKSLRRMSERCDPYIFYHRVRPFLSGWKGNPTRENGLVYEGVDGHKAKLFNGGSAAQSSILPTIDAFLSTPHTKGSAVEFLKDMRNYMPPSHANFIEWVSTQPKIQDLFEPSPKSLDDNFMVNLKAAFNECVVELSRFRSAHIAIVHTYIINQQKKLSKGVKASSNESKGKREGAAGGKGTGGTGIMDFLKPCRQATDSNVLK
eukprot:g2321.t1